LNPHKFYKDIVPALINLFSYFFDPRAPFQYSRFVGRDSTQASSRVGLKLWGYLTLLGYVL